ncbi:DNA mismatch repair endonuclease MutL [Anaerotignum lactatifermentans]|uniref:DNA mismatch repair protein MutL n=1 Tax=Anaerotignum lactatifermentans TaxID=160404 RepID=A0ABS2GBD2_9FIRM|nr:DNA mismatch repair endonuclease MutL [Anaerotignum lactatifermentans]MBM6828511.1 DNA mismatch repair endonuclease MutL [Anaerotignum lactatifermentans]MBM6877918.1 DNA mismatch repair endonuclease MutL [Anaerotignum lactatifermentans]MBM6950093.1 DNA mismatch repair endonuclease MutL [Anaerotignum lactatifermentans]
MQKIQLLDQKTINKIAAGEVVESPKSVVKELTENAMDAGASTVTVEIREGGTSYIRVTDNGCGIPKDQVKEAFLRHSTSKLSQIEDLEHIFTMGFRGEALASIAAVAQVEMTTKTKDEEMGTLIQISGGEVKTIQDVACTEGTTVVVQNLFYNVPARRKFLKKPATESSYVSDLMNKLALGHPEMSFCYINNGASILHTSGNGDGRASVFYVYGKEAANAMMEISYAKGDYRVTGLIGKPELSRGNRNYENLFINGRFIKNSIVSSAVEDAYKTRIMIGKFPVYVLNLEVDPSLVDVNVHPAKLEVRFKNDDEVYDFFYDAISSAFSGQVLIPRANLEKKAPPQAEKTEQQTLSSWLKPKEAVPAFPRTESSPARQDISYTQREKEAPAPGGGRSVDQLLKRNTSQKTSVREDGVSYQKENVQAASLPKDFVLEEAETAKQTAAPAPKEAEKTPFFQNYRIVGQVFDTYWLVEQRECLYLIDQHAAHERILFERLMKEFKEQSIVSQRLLTPVMLRLTEREKEVLRENQTLLEGFGFGIEEFSGKEYALCAVPFLMKSPSGTGFFTEILDQLETESPVSLYDMKLMTVATMACKAAVKGHDRLSVQEADRLIEDLLKLENPFTCPHGRPTIVEWTKYQMEKMFKRIQD